MLTEVVEVRLHGRGGQGAVSAAALLSRAAFEDGYEAQAFPKFGAERRGAPVEAYVRISAHPIRTHNQVYHPHAVVIQDATLLRSEPVLAGLQSAGIVVLNSEQAPAGRDESLCWIVLPASRLSAAVLGRPLPNTVLLGALAAASGWVSLQALEEAVRERFTAKGDELVEGNLRALRQGFEAAESHAEATS